MINQKQADRNNEIAMDIITRYNARNLQEALQEHPGQVSSDFRTAGGRCVHCCKGYITDPIMRFFDCIPDKFMCYECQRKGGLF